MMNRVLVIAVHPDDETLGCGGTLLKFLDNKDKLFWLIITNMKTEYGYDESAVIRRNQEIINVGIEYSFTKIFNLEYPPKMLDQIPLAELVSKISEVIEAIQPTIVLFHYQNDVHTDHQYAFKAIISSTKNFRFPSIKKLLIFETLSETEFSPTYNGSGFTPNYFIDITPYLDKKLKIMQKYSTELMPEPLPRSLSSIKAQARYRGSRIGVEYGEAFILLFAKE